MIEFSRRTIAASWFQHSITALIVFSALLIGLATDAEIEARWGAWFEWAHHIVVAIFILEAALKMTAASPRPWDYFRSPWNVFDFVIIVLSLVPASGDLALIARLARLLRVLRLISALPELRLIVATLVRSIPSMGNVILLMSIIFYIYAVAGFHFFHQVDPTHWSSLGISLLSLFRIVTLEDWTDIMYAAMEVNPWAWIYFVSFVVLGTFVIVNLFIAVVINNLDEAKAERLRELQPVPARDELLAELRETQERLQRLQLALERRLRED